MRTDVTFTGVEGARGVARLAFFASHGLLYAVADATGVRLTRPPATRERVREALATATR